MSNPINTLEHLYAELGERICLYPFFGAFYQTNNVIPIEQANKPNSVRPCSIVMAEDWAKWDITSGSITEARNSPAWREMRTAMLEGRMHEVFDCRSCAYNEQSGTTSPRQMNNKFYTEFLDIDIVEEVKAIAANDNTVKDIITLDYYPSNYCNYSCVMCAGGASSQRQVYEVKVLGRQEKIVLNQADPDFYDVLRRVEIINFTGGETALQKEVLAVMDWFIEQDLAKNVLITMLTNASSSPNHLLDRFKHFKKVIYNVSVDGTKRVIEYQRRGCNWNTVDANTAILMNHKDITCVINYVLTAINVFTAMDFVDWAYTNQYGTKHEWDTCQYLTISPVFRLDFLGVAALPPELRTIALERLYAGRERYKAIQASPMVTSMIATIDKFISVIESTEHNPAYIAEFVDYIRKEDSVSKLPLIAVVPEWAAYFN